MKTFGAKVYLNIWGENIHLYIHVTYSLKTEWEKTFIVLYGFDFRIRTCIRDNTISSKI